MCGLDPIFSCSAGRTAFPRSPCCSPSYVQKKDVHCRKIIFRKSLMDYDKYSGNELTSSVWSAAEIRYAIIFAPNRKEISGKQ